VDDGTRKRVVAVDCQSRSFLPDSSVPTFPECIINAVFDPNATIVASRGSSVATQSQLVATEKLPHAVIIALAPKAAAKK
jgi:hypothetical protein